MFKAANLKCQPAKAAANGQSGHLRLPEFRGVGAISKATEDGQNIQAWLASETVRTAESCHARHAARAELA